jgi:cytochrome P450
MHAVRRRWITPVFSTDSLRAGEGRVIEIIERFCETIKPKDGGWGEKWNASDMSTYLGFDIMGAMVFGAEFRTVQEEENRALAESVLPASMLMYWVRTVLERRYSCANDPGVLPTSSFHRPATLADELV